MESKIDELVKIAKAAINTVFSDTAVSQETTVEYLEELRDEIIVMINAIKEDIKFDGEESGG